MTPAETNTRLGLSPNQILYHFRLQIVKIIASLMVVISFFLKANSLWFNLSASVAIGCFYYLMIETQPQLMFLFSMIVKYQVNKFYLKWIKTPLNTILSFFETQKDKVNLLQEEDEYQSLEYQDCKYHKKYIYLFNKNLRSNDLIIFKDENEDDITDYIEPYLGPLQDFHGSLLTPKDFNHKKISVFRDGEINLSKTFEENDPIVFK